MNKMLREPHYHTIRYLYPRLYRIDNLKYNQPEILEKYDLKDEQIITNMGYTSETLGITIKPYMLWLTYDEILLEGIF
jgi:hypothetical protein